MCHCQSSEDSWDLKLVTESEGTRGDSRVSIEINLLVSVPKNMKTKQTRPTGKWEDGGSEDGKTLVSVCMFFYAKVTFDLCGSMNMGWTQALAQLSPFRMLMFFLVLCGRPRLFIVSVHDNARTTQAWSAGNTSHCGRCDCKQRCELHKSKNTCIEPPEVRN